MNIEHDEAKRSQWSADENLPRKKDVTLPG